MDSTTLSLVIVIFLASLAFFFATAVAATPPTPLPETPKNIVTIENIKIAPVLRQNVAVARFVRTDR